jgi:predicted secreted protein
MATTSVFNGTNLVILVGTEVIAHAKNCSLSVKANLPDASTKDSLGWAEHIAGQMSWSLKTDGLATVQPTATTYIVGDIFTALTARTAVTVKFTTYNGTAVVAGDLVWSGSAFIESLDMTADMEAPVTFSASFTGTSTLTQGTNA